MNRYFFLIGLLLVFITPFAHGQAYESLYTFWNSTNGAFPQAGLLQGSDGNFYGTTGGDGSLSFRGTVFRMTPNGTLTTLITLSNSIGIYPQAELIECKDGNFYGTTQQGGTNGSYGTVFRITPNGSLTTLFAFDSVNGRLPQASVIQGSDGLLYGTTYYGGAYDSGTIFRLTTNGSLTTLVSFSGNNGWYPNARLLLASDGCFYGTTEDGGASYCGTVFKMTTNGILTTLASFNGGNGRYPMAGLTEGLDGNFYGATQKGGVNNYGTVFKLTPGGTLTRLFSFNNTNGAYPMAELTMGTDGDFYGTTAYGGITQFGSFNAGTIFKITANGSLSTLFIFGYGNNGANPYGPLILSKDGNFYGTTRFGGSSGNVFRIVMPSLNSKQTGGKLVVSWPTNQIGFTLQFTTNVVTQTNWINSTSSPVVVGGQFTITNTISGSSQFYRLRK